MKPFRCIFYLLSFLLMGGLWGLSHWKRLHHQVVLQIDTASGGDCIVYFDRGHGFREVDIAYVLDLPPGLTEPLHFKIPLLRESPPLKILLRGMEGEVSFPFIQLKQSNLFFWRTETDPPLNPWSGIQSMKTENGITRFTVESPAFFLVRAQSPAPLISLNEDTALGLSVVGGAAAGLFLSLLLSALLNPSQSGLGRRLNQPPVVERQGELG